MKGYAGCFFGALERSWRWGGFAIPSRPFSSSLFFLFLHGSSCQPKLQPSRVETGGFEGVRAVCEARMLSSLTPGAVQL